MSKQKVTTEQRKEILLVAIYLFFQFGRKEEVSRSELIDCLTEFQKKFPLGYEFEKKVPYVSSELSKDLDDLYLHKGYIKCYRYGPRDTLFFPGILLLCAHWVGGTLKR